MNKEANGRAPVERPVRYWHCRFGIHKWTLRELHFAEIYRNTQEPVLMSIIERCTCGAALIPPRGQVMPTVRCLSAKYLPEELKHLAT